MSNLFTELINEMLKKNTVLLYLILSLSLPLFVLFHGPCKILSQWFPFQ